MAPGEMQFIPVSKADQIKIQTEKYIFFSVFSLDSNNVKYSIDRELDILLLFKNLF